MSANVIMPSPFMSNDRSVLPDAMAADSALISSQFHSWSLLKSPLTTPPIAPTSTEPISTTPTSPGVNPRWSAPVARVPLPALMTGLPAIGKRVSVPPPLFISIPNMGLPPPMMLPPVSVTVAVVLATPMKLKEELT